MALLFAITLNLSLSVSRDLVRVEDQTIRIVSLLSSFGAFYSLIISKHKCNNFNNKDDIMKEKGTSIQID